MSISHPARPSIARQREHSLPDRVRPERFVAAGADARLERFRQVPGTQVSLPGYSHHWLIVQENAGPERMFVGPRHQEKNLSGALDSEAILYLPAYQPSEWDFSAVAGSLSLLMPDCPMVEALLDHGLPATALADLRLWLGESDAVLARALRGLSPWLDASAAGGAPGAAAKPDPLVWGVALRGIAWRLVARQLGSQARPPAEDRRRLSNADLARVRALVHARFAEPLTLEELAGPTGLNIFSFTRKFKLKTGVSPVHYVLRVRASHVRALLADPRQDRLPLAEIALQAGFCDQSHMTRVFKEICGTTPARVREGRLGRTGRWLSAGAAR